jgi:hypothetical protein
MGRLAEFRNWGGMEGYLLNAKHVQPWRAVGPQQINQFVHGLCNAKRQGYVGPLIEPFRALRQWIGQLGYRLWPLFFAHRQRDSSIAKGGRERVQKGGRVPFRRRAEYGKPQPQCAVGQSIRHASKIP